MKTIAPVIFIMIFLFVISPFKNKAQEYDKDDKIRIGFILDGERKDFDDFIETIKQEIGVLLDSKYKKLKFPEEKLYMSDWTARGITENINAILSDEEVDIVIGIGTITSALLVDLAPFEKPVITIGIIHPTFQRVPITEDNTSGINNFTYVTLPFSPARDIEVFQSIYPYNNLGILISEEFLKTVPSSSKLKLNWILDITSLYSLREQGDRQERCKLLKGASGSLLSNIRIFRSYRYIYLVLRDHFQNEVIFPCLSGIM